MATTLRARFRAEPADVRAGQCATLILAITDERGAVVSDLEVVHEKPMHLLATPEDLSELHHLHPERMDDGSFRAVHTFRYGGTYRVYADFKPARSGPVVDRFTLVVGGDGRPAMPLVAFGPGAQRVQEHGVSVTLTTVRSPRAGEDALLGFSVADARTGEPVADLQPYLGARAHFVIISQDGKDFLHAHALERAATATGGGGHARAHEHGSGKSIASEVSAHTRFPRAGLYRVWAQLQRDGRIVTAPFVVNVVE